MRNNIVYTFLTSQTHPFIATLIMFLLRLPFVSGEVKVVEINSLDDRSSKRYEQTKDFLENLKSIVIELKQSGLSKHEIIDKLENDFKKYKVNYYGLPRDIFDIWDELEGN